MILAVISKLRPRVKRSRTFDLDDLADEIAVQSGFDKGDARDFAYKFAQGLINHLKFGDYVKLGDIGSFSMAGDFRGEFVNAQNAGLDMDGFANLWLRKIRGIPSSCGMVPPGQPHNPSGNTAVTRRVPE